MFVIVIGILGGDVEVICVVIVIGLGFVQVLWQVGSVQSRISNFQGYIGRQISVINVLSVGFKDWIFIVELIDFGEVFFYLFDEVM